MLAGKELDSLSDVGNFIKQTLVECNRQMHELKNTGVLDDVSFCDSFFSRRIVVQPLCVYL